MTTTTAPSLDVRWCTDPGRAQELAQFFVANITPDYISHSELQGDRALDIGKWQPGLADIVAREIEGRVAEYDASIETVATSYPVLEARSEGQLVGIALSFFRDAPSLIPSSRILLSRNRAESAASARPSSIGCRAKPKC